MRKVKNVIGSIFTLSIIALLLSNATQTYLTDTETSTGNTFTACEFEFDSGGFGTSELPIELSCMEPCQTGYFDTTLYNEGDIDIEIWKHITNVVCTENGITEPEQTWYDEHGIGSLLGYWRFEEGAPWDGTADEVTDRSPYENHGYAVNGAIQHNPGKVGQCAEFDGDDDYITVDPSDFQFGTGEPFSVECWMKTTQSVSNPHQILGTYGGPTYPTPNQFWSMFLENGKIKFGMRVNDNEDYSYVYSTSLINDDEWHHIVVVKDTDSVPAKMRVYIDGTEEASTTFTDGETYNNYDLRMGNGHWGRHYGGLLDEVAIWSKILTETEIEDHYNNLGVFIGDSAFWPDDTQWIYATDDNRNFFLEIPTDIRDIYYYEDANRVFIRVGTQVDWDSTYQDGSTLGVVMDDPLIDPGAAEPYELAISTTRRATTDYATGYYWEAANNHWETEQEDMTSHIRINPGTFSGVDFAFDKSEMRDHYPTFNTDLVDSGNPANNVRMRIYTTDHTTNAFEDHGNGGTHDWYSQRTPGNWVDDVADFTCTTPSVPRKEGTGNDIDTVILYDMWIGDIENGCEEEEGERWIIKEEEGWYISQNDDRDPANPPPSDPNDPPCDINGIYCHWIYVGTIPAGESIEVVQSYHLEGETENWAQSDQVQFTIEWYAQQVGGSAPGPELPGHGKADWEPYPYP